MSRRTHSREHGVALIELALVLPLLILLTLIATEFGRAVYQYNTIAKSVRDAARYLTTQAPNTGASAARNLVVYGTTSPGGSATPLVPGLTLSNVPASTPSWQTAGTDPVINTVTITVSGFCFAPMVTNVLGISFTTADCGIPFGNISATMRAPS